MEILSQTEATASFYIMTGFLGLVAAFLLFVGIGVFISMIIDRNFEASGIFGTIATLAFAAFIIYGLTQGIKQGAEVTYKATITDFNEVYENGYEIVSQEDKIYTLRKVESEEEN